MHTLHSVKRSHKSGDHNQLSPERNTACWNSRVKIVSTCTVNPVTYGHCRHYLASAIGGASTLVRNFVGQWYHCDLRPYSSVMKHAISNSNICCFKSRKIQTQKQFCIKLTHNILICIQYMTTILLNGECIKWQFTLNPNRNNTRTTRPHLLCGRKQFLNCI